MVVERDYVIHHVMASIGRTRAAEQLQFKGELRFVSAMNGTTVTRPTSISMSCRDSNSAVASIRDALEDCLAQVGFSHLVCARRQGHLLRRSHSSSSELQGRH